MSDSEENKLKDLVLQKRDEGNVVFLQHGGDFAVMSMPIAEFISQPVDGILYDLNRLEEIALTYMDEPKWVNDFAVALTIRALHEERDALLAVVRTAQWIPDWETMRKAIEWSTVNDKVCGDYPTIRWGAEAYLESERLGRIDEALAALPEHLKGGEGE